MLVATYKLGTLAHTVKHLFSSASEFKSLWAVHEMIYTSQNEWEYDNLSEHMEDHQEDDAGPSAMRTLLYKLRSKLMINP